MKATHREPAQGSDIAQTLGLDNVRGRSGRQGRWAAILVVLLLVVLGSWAWLAGHKSPDVRYVTAEATRGDLTVSVTATGTLQPVNQVDVGSYVSGTIWAVLVDFNDRVEQGQVLAVLDTDQFQARVNQASAALQLAAAQVKQSEATIIETRNRLRRASELQKVGMTPQEDLDGAQAAHARAVADLARSQAQVEQARAALDAERTTLAKATLRSPINGIVLNRVVEPGQTVAASFQTPVLFTLAENLTQMELHVDVDEADVGLIREGQEAGFTVDAYAKRRFPATITEVHYASQTVDGVVTYETVLQVDNSELLLRPGMTATADIVVKQIGDALLVPNAALRFEPPGPEAAAASEGGGGFSLLPRPPHATKAHTQPRLDKPSDRVWTLRDGRPVPLSVVTGSTNGIVTEILAGEVAPGMALLVDTVASGT
jgi:HlyD family secretion protein